MTFVLLKTMVINNIPKLVEIGEDPGPSPSSMSERVVENGILSRGQRYDFRFNSECLTEIPYTDYYHKFSKKKVPNLRPLYVLPYRSEHLLCSVKHVKICTNSDKNQQSFHLGHAHTQQDVDLQEKIS
ncbi:hypothetical protein NQ317_010507 [Molorchus minor]|uniref:Uncharacterized protein n=1 Tax=Molorchus minor TaxID=1323400 RepID=A0ABQ9JMZ8_9CUCU|nr:hypothetical protein NQ317_010507 [Molorchus minor]